MAVVTKIKIYKTGKVQAGEFIEDSNEVSMKVNSDVHVSELDETGDGVSISKDGKLTSNEFVEL